MSKVNGCKACKAKKTGVKSRISIPHTCGKGKVEIVCTHITFMDKTNPSVCFLCGEDLPAGFENPINSI